MQCFLCFNFLQDYCSLWFHFCLFQLLPSVSFKTILQSNIVQETRVSSRLMNKVRLTLSQVHKHWIKLTYSLKEQNHREDENQTFQKKRKKHITFCLVSISISKQIILEPSGRITTAWLPTCDLEGFKGHLPSTGQPSFLFLYIVPTRLPDSLPNHTTCLVFPNYFNKIVKGRKEKSILSCTYPQREGSISYFHLTVPFFYITQRAFPSCFH